MLTFVGAAGQSRTRACRCYGRSKKSLEITACRLDNEIRSKSAKTQRKTFLEKCPKCIKNVRPNHYAYRVSTNERDKMFTQIKDSGVKCDSHDCKTPAEFIVSGAKGIVYLGYCPTHNPFCIDCGNIDCDCTC